jgi:hypothetical protein
MLADTQLRQDHALAFSSNSLAVWLRAGDARHSAD